ncbi:hypothetical protein ACVFVO_07780 [Advenella kashmirensis]
MTKTTISSKAQQRLDNPLLQKDFTTKPNEKLRIRITANSKNLTTSARALLCRIIFFDATSKPIEENYDGAFFSAIYGNYLYIPSTTGSEKGEWLKRTITVPKSARTVRLIILEGESKIDHLRPLKDIECISGNLPLLETSLPITSQLPNKLSLYFTKRIDARNAGLVSIVYFDQDENEIQGPHLNLAYSARYGYFKYIHRTGDANTFDLCLLPPKSAISMQLRVYGLQSTINFEFKRSPKLEIYPIYANLMRSESWQRISPHETIRLAVPPNHISGEVYELSLQYVAYCENETFEVLIQAGSDKCTSDDATPFNCHEKAISLSDTSNKQHKENLNIYVPENATFIDLTFRLTHFDTVLLKKDINLNKIATKFNFAYSQPKSQFGEEVLLEISSLWKPLLLVSIPSGEKSYVTSPNVEILITFYDASQAPLSIDLAPHKSVFGHIFQINTSTLKLSPGTGSVSAEMSDSIITSVALFHPPETCCHLGIKILDSADVTTSNVQLKFSQFHTLIPERVTDDSYDVILTDTELPATATRSLLACLTNKFPNAPAVLNQALQTYRRLGDLAEPTKLSTHILNNIRNAATRNQARLFLAELESLSPTWSPSTNVAKTTSQHTSNVIARLLGTHTSEQDQTPDFYTCDEEVKFFFITPLGYPGLGKTGYPWEKENRSDTTRYRLNCVSPENLATVPMTIQIEFSALLSAQILQTEHTDIIHATIQSTDYHTAIIALTLSKALDLPLVLEFIDNLLFEDPKQQEHTERSLKVLLQLCRCAQEAAAIIVASDKKSHYLLKQGIKSEKIFTSPFTESKKQSLRTEKHKKPDNTAKTYNDVYHYVQNKLVND